MSTYGAPLIITKHAVDRWRQRFDHDIDVDATVKRFLFVTESASWRSTPRHWMRNAGVTPGVRYGYNSAAPDVCLVRRGLAVVTVLTRSMFPTTGTACDSGPERRARACLLPHHDDRGTRDRRPWRRLPQGDDY
jgi:hypothetical protein